LRCNGVARTLLGWALIVVGLAGVVSGLGMFYVYSLLPADGAEYGDTHAQLFGRYLPWSAPAIGFCGGGAAGTVVGLVLVFVGLNLRASPSGGASRKRKRGKRRDCRSCGATNAPETVKCYRCGKPL
jgi:hypothetical protein